MRADRSCQAPVKARSHRFSAPTLTGGGHDDRCHAGNVRPGWCHLTDGNRVLATVPAVKPVGRLVIPSQQYRAAGGGASRGGHGRRSRRSGRPTGPVRHRWRVRRAGGVRRDRGGLAGTVAWLARPRTPRHRRAGCRGRHGGGGVGGELPVLHRAGQARDLAQSSPSPPMTSCPVTARGYSTRRSGRPGRTPPRNGSWARPAASARITCRPPASGIPARSWPGTPGTITVIGRTRACSRNLRYANPATP